MTGDKQSNEETAQEPAPRRRDSVIEAWMRRFLASWRRILLIIAVVGATGFGVGYFYFEYRPDLQTNDAVAHQVVKAASDGAVALLSYSPTTLERDFTNAKSRLTDHYLDYYRRFADQIVGPSAQRGQVTTSATVIKAAVLELHPSSAAVLVFVKQKTASREKPEPVVTSSSLRVALSKVKGSWLIDKLDAV
jgi:Mce-associated membrane protein